MSELRKTIEGLIEDFTTHANRGSLHHASAVIPNIFNSILELIDGKTTASEDSPEEKSSDAPGISDPGHKHVIGDLTHDNGVGDPGATPEPTPVVEETAPEDPTVVKKDPPPVEEPVEANTADEAEADVDTTEKKPTKAKKGKAE